MEFFIRPRQSTIDSKTPLKRFAGDDRREQINDAVFMNFGKLKGKYFPVHVISKKTVKYVIFTFARLSRRDARAVSCEPRIYFFTLQDLSNAARLVAFRSVSRPRHARQIMHHACNFLQKYQKW